MLTSPAPFAHLPERGWRGEGKALLSKAASLAYQQPKGHEARRVAVASFIAMLSSMLCYANFAAVWVNWYVAMACDSIVNDACVLAVLLMGDAAQYSSRPTSDSVADMMARSLFPLRTTRMKACQTLRAQRKPDRDRTIIS